MSELNPQQQQIVEHLDGPALVIAGAGSGKTRVITHRVAHLIAKGVPPGTILMVTFTNKAADEMSQRVGTLLGDDKGGRVISGTFHSVANRFLRRYAALVGYGNNFTILDDADSRDLIKAVIADTTTNSERRFPVAKVVQSAISGSFNRSLELRDYLRSDYPWLMEFVSELESIEQRYRQKKRDNNAMDFDDLLGNWHRLLSEHPNLELARSIRYIMVDEYQDTNRIQAQILELLAREHRNLMVVGDDAQSIYGWRGADFRNILEFPQRFGGQVYKLEENYRSTPNILDLANASINHNTAQFAKHLRSVKPPSVKPTVYHVYDQYEEAELVVQRILQYADEDIPLRGMGVLYRNHAQSATVQMRLQERGIPFVVRSGIKFFEQAHIKDAIAFLKVVFNPLDEIAWLRLLKLLPGIGNKTAQRIIRIFQDQRAVRLAPDNDALVAAVPKKARGAWQSLAATFKALLGDELGPADMIEVVRHGYYHDLLYTNFDNPNDRDADLAYMAEFASRYRSLERFLAQLALVGSTVIRDYEEDLEGDDDYITLTTIHQAKGLEWDAVLLVGLADGKFPHARCLEPPERLEEERRLFYVAATRAKRYLDITVPLISFNNGAPEICRPSRFVEELPHELVEIVKAGNVDELKPYMGTRATLSVDW
ncbi:MAG: ATP-dependent helicase [Candidatus Lambdaproteobacteria bacterium]|nr:ATP-dependent helicase [Candidatus Lambdaproteobacteria bacterium]